MTNVGTSGDESTRASARSSSRWRQLVGVLALYALVLQALLGGIAALPNADAPGVICQQQSVGDAAPADPHAPAHHHTGCCTLAAFAAAIEPPVCASAAIVWPPRAVTRFVWRMEGVASARAPPGSIASPRAPPVV